MKTVGMLRWLLFVCVCMTGGGWRAVASSLNQTLVYRPGQVRIHADILLDSLPERGRVPMRLTLRNELDRAGEWRLVFSSERRANTRVSTTTTHVLSAGPRETRVVNVSVPVAPGTAFRYYRGVLNVEVRGPGVPPGTSSRLLSSSGSRRATRTRHLGMDRGVARTLKEPLREVTDSKRDDMVAHTLDNDLFPAEWTGLSGLDVLFLQPDTWKNPRVRDPVLRWVAMGGHLILDADEGQSRRVGMGHIHVRELPDTLPGAENVYRDLTRMSTRAHRLESRRYGRDRWAFGDRVAAIAPSMGPFMLVVVAIAAILGPVNLWWGHKRRHMVRVLWTTPALSAGLSVLVGAGILLGDGFGGKGQRSLWIHVIPEENLELRLQEQVSRTGVLFRKTFSLPPETLVFPVHADDRDIKADQRLDLNPDGTHAGDWFANRSIQAQALERVRASRADLRVTSPPGAPTPRLVSTLNAPLSVLVYRDARGRFWSARNVSPGEDIRPRSMSPEEARRETETWFNRDGHPGRAWIQDFPHGAFAARSNVPGDVWMDTLPGINWESRPVVFTGRATLDAETSHE